MRSGFGGIVVLALMLWLGAGICYAQATEAGPLQVGIATADITPEGPVWMGGYAARNKPSEGTYKELTATCVVFDNGQTRVAFVAIDLVAIYEKQLADLRAAAAKAGIPPQHLMTNASHTHCGPRVSHKDNAEYTALFQERTDPLFEAAVADLQPAVLDYTVGYSTMAVNRRQLNDEGKCIGMRPEPRKQIDPDVPILRVLSPEGNIRAVIFGYACHPTTMGGYLNGPDYPGFARDWIAAAIPDCTPVFLQGCGGDIKPRYSKTNGRFGYVMLEAIPTTAEMGHELGRAVIAALCAPPLVVPADRPTDLQEAAKMPVTIGGIVEHIRVPDKETEGKTHQIYNGAWRIGDVYIFGSQCEVCSNIGLRIKRELSDLRVWTNGYTHWGGGYIPDAASYPEEGYEVRVSRVSPATEDILVGNAKRYIAELQKTPVHSEPIPETGE
jgi:neutral ceramidase